MVAKFLDHNNRELKQQTFHMQHAFLYISWLRYTNATWNFLISRACIMEYVNTTQKVSFSFSKLRCGPFGFIPGKFRQHLTNEMKFSRIEEVRNSANWLKITFSVCCHLEILLPWQRDVMTSLCSISYRFYCPLQTTSNPSYGLVIFGAQNLHIYEFEGKQLFLALNTIFT